jgi:hypothetical protein
MTVEFAPNQELPQDQQFADIEQAFLSPDSTPGQILNTEVLESSVDANAVEPWTVVKATPSNSSDYIDESSRVMLMKGDVGNGRVIRDTAHIPAEFTPKENDIGGTFEIRDGNVSKQALQALAIHGFKAARAKMLPELDGKSPVKRLETIIDTYDTIEASDRRFVVRAERNDKAARFLTGVLPEVVRSQKRGDLYDNGTDYYG